MSSIKPYKTGVCKICRQSGDREDKPLIGNLCYTAEPFHYQKHQEEKTAGYIEKDTERKRKKHLEANKKAFAVSKNVYIELPSGEKGNIYPRIKKVSDRRASQLRIYEKEKKAFLEINNVCEFPGCESTEVAVHHSAGRVEDLLYDSNFFRALCWPHHKWVEENPCKAKEMGLSYDRINK